MEQVLCAASRSKCRLIAALSWGPGHRQCSTTVARPHYERVSTLHPLRVALLLVLILVLTLGLSPRKCPGAVADWQCSHNTTTSKLNDDFNPDPDHVIWSQGKRHIIPMEGDVGTCELPLRVRLFTANVTWLQFWGMYDFHPSWGHIFHNRIPCHVPGRVSCCKPTTIRLRVWEPFVRYGDRDTLPLGRVIVHARPHAH